MHIIITGIHTEVGKTLASAVLTFLLQADYWKPLQSGSLENSDSHQVHRLSGATCHPEAYQLSYPLAATKQQSVKEFLFKITALSFLKQTNL